MDALKFTHQLQFSDLPAQVVYQTEMCLLDLLGIAIGGTTTRLSAIIRTHANSQFGGPHAMLFDGRSASAAGTALAGAMTIDALDGHDGFNPAKGHVGCGLFPAALAIARDTGAMGGSEFLTTIAMGYELGSRLGPALHATAPDYHTSGAWIAVAAAAAGARLLKLDTEQTAHAFGIAEYHGPRSQMMRCIDHPTMLKDGSGWGAMAGVSAAFLARDGFTGTPALTITEPAEIWGGLGENWLILQQYFKPYPVCRWAQSPIVAALALRSEYNLQSSDIIAIEVASFHESTRLATNNPRNTEEAQYSTSFPTAIALVRGNITAKDISDEALQDPEIERLSNALTMVEDDTANAAFPDVRLGSVTLTLKDGTKLQSGLVRPQWDADTPPSEQEFRNKFHALADPLIGRQRAVSIEDALHDLPKTGLAPLVELITQPISDATTSGN